MDKAILVGILDLYRSPKPQGDNKAEDVDLENTKEELEPLPPLSLSEFWPPSPRVRILLIGLGFFLINFILLGVFVVVWATNN